ncbi:hypothetical protein H8959_016746 [Pygathrix nigripes]
MMCSSQEDGEPGAQPGSSLSADLFAQSLLDCPLSRLQLFPLTHCCGPGLRPTSQEDKATQTLGPASPSQGVMLPCGVTEEPQRLFYGNAGYRLPLPASFPAVLPIGEQPPEGQWQHRAEVQIARKLQCIADQFHRLHVQQHQQNRNRVWWQILLFLHNLALNGEENRNGAGPRYPGDITSSWSEFYSQGVYHDLSAKKTGSCYAEKEPGTSVRTGSGTH